MQQLEVLEDNAHLLAQARDTAPFDVRHFLAEDDGLFGIFAVNIQLAVERLQ